PRKCETCGGTGRVTYSQHEEKGHVLIQHITLCSTCHGRGSINEHPCPECHGSGEVEQEEVLTVKIPVGIEEGMALRIPGKGMPSPVTEGTVGDLFVVVRSRPDPRFERAGADLLQAVTLPLPDAVLGTVLKVSTLDGSSDVTVPPGTQPGTILRLKGKGLPQFGSDRHGDLYLRIGLQVPERLSREEHELYERLRQIARKIQPR
ncbi:MAG: J domain-containing protein, partial [Betaproteobacteria bacterium]|nr:J domain-containing protein [Betaproteobacteria bacterium]